MHALVEVLKLQLALLLGPDLADTMPTLDPLLLESVAPRCPLVWLRPALCQHPTIQVDAQLRLEVDERHDTMERGQKRQDG